ncbi:MAG: GDSL-type esterase/lipase family protein [Tannerella sp.]|jgi:lysophospholipase L1-like esterase|nr:GDSL-type esterase/lipase family protein [Tannerella sp.]
MIEKQTDAGSRRVSRRFGKIRTALLIAGFAGCFYGVFPVPEKESPEAMPEKAFAPRAALTDSVTLQLPFAVDSLCRITDLSHSLDVFLEGLELLLSGRDTVIKIVHLGDSHVQAGFYSGQVMHMLHDAFGNAGRGWISPLKLAKVNEPNDYRITSPAVKEWIIGRCIQKEPGCPWGLGGIGIQPCSEVVDFSISMTPDNGAGYAFNELYLYRDETATPLFPRTEDTAWVEAVRGIEPRAPHVVVDTFRMALAVDSLYLNSVVDRQDTASTAGNSAGGYYGFSLKNGRPGILYHAIGQNGAMFVNYTNREYLHQLSLLEPSLLIITLGTNEAYSMKFRAPDFVAQMNSFIGLVREYMPSAAILLTTPAESYRRTRNGYVRNENISRAAKAITEYAGANGIACFDLYRATGGSNSCTEWKKANLLGRDRIHYTKEGYYEQGKLLYRGLIRLKINQQNRVSGESV